MTSFVTEIREMEAMALNGRLILLLSLFGLALGILTVVWIPGHVEPFVLLGIFILCAYFVAKYAPAKYFLHGFLISIANAVWITTAHVIFYGTYMANHPELMELNAQLPMQNTPQVFMAITGPFVGALLGLVLGLFCWIASKIVRRKGA